MKEVTYEDWVKNPTPREMWVWDTNASDKLARKVVHIFSEGNLADTVLTVTKDDSSYCFYMHCSEIEEPKYRRMTCQELAWWLRENPTREYTVKGTSIAHFEYSYCANEEADAPADDDILIRENGGEWHEPLVEVEE